MSAPLIGAEELACRRGGRLLWSKLSLSLCAGDLMHITGANGIGKSSLMRVLAGLLPPSEGRVEVQASVGLLDERLALDRNRSLYDALRFWADCDGADGADITAALNDVGLASLADIPIGYLSTGQRKRAAMAMVIVQNALVWLLDEPLNGLDAEGQRLMAAAIAAHRSNGGCALIASHHPIKAPSIRPLDLDLYRA